MKLILTILTLTFLVGTSYGQNRQTPEEAKAKAKAALALAFEKEKTIRVIKSDMIFNDIDKAKAKSIEKGWPLVLWVGQVNVNSEVIDKIPNLVHCTVPSFPAVPDAKCVVFICDKKTNNCKQKSSTNVFPTVEVLKSMLKDTEISTTVQDFMINSEMEMFVSDDDYEYTEFIQTKVCFDEFGRQVPCEPLTPNLVVIKNTDGTTTITDAPVVTSYTEIRRFGSGFKTWRENRQRVFTGRLLSRFFPRLFSR